MSPVARIFADRMPSRRATFTVGVILARLQMLAALAVSTRRNLN